MSNIDLRNYVVAKWGKWHETAGSFSADQLRLNDVEDGLALAGPLSVRVSVTARNNVTLLGASAVAECEREAFGYTLQLGPGQVWAYPEPRAQQAAALRALAERIGDTSGSQKQTSSTTATGIVASAGVATTVNPATLALSTSEAAALRAAEILRVLEAVGLRLGTNAGFGMTIRPIGSGLIDECGNDACGTVGRKGGCGCNGNCGCSGGCGGSCGCGCSSCQCQTQGDGIPCNYAQRGGPNLSWYFPSACEPCTPGAAVGVPPSTATTTLVRPASGGIVRTRYFNGMFITREDLETDQRNVRLKRSLMNRALGQGVAWGFEVSSDGDAICVLPGYGVDCCGNDIVLATPYRVNADALVRDPAAASALSSRKAQAMSLVLEYFECPEEPRPVHGDPCSTDVTRCETSRIRETARLRLAPPCEVDTSGCIEGFLKEIEKDSVLATALQNAKNATTPATAPQTAPPLTMAIQLQAWIPVSGTPTDVGQTGQLIPPAAPVTTPAQGDAPVFGPNTDAGERQYLVILAQIDGYTWVSGSLVPGPLGSGTVSNPTTSTNDLTWQVPVPPLQTFTPTPGMSIAPQVNYYIQNWKIQDANGNTYSAPQIEIDLTTLTIAQWKDTTWAQTAPPAGPGGAPPSFIGPAKDERVAAVVHLTIPPFKMTVTTPGTGTTTGFPCLTEACSGEPRFETTPPFLHDNPQVPGQAADPRVLLMTLAYAFLVGDAVEVKNGGTVNVALVRFVRQVLGALAKSTFPDTDLSTLLEGIQRLLKCWCRALLYPGPKCLCSPHGVVIGCARVDAGRITMVDPWGGRRWIVHYPLLAYWGQQFGIMPLDAIASRLFDTLCCIASLAPAGGGGGIRPGPIPPVHVAVNPLQDTSATTNAQSPLAAIPLGTSMLVLEDAKTLGTKLAALGVQSVRSQTVSSASFAMRVWNAANAGLTAPAPSTTSSTGSTSSTFASAPPPAPSATPTSLVDYVLQGFPNVHLLVPDTGATAAATPSAAPSTQAQGSLDAIVGASVTSAPQGSAPPPLLRSFTASLSKRLLSVSPLEPTDTVQHAAADALASGGVTTVADLLSRDPETLLQNTLKGANADGLNGLIANAETTAKTVAADVADTTTKVAAQSNATSRADLTNPTRAATLSKAIADRLATASVAVTPEIVGRAVKAAASGT